MANFGRIVLALLCCLFALTMALPKTPVFGFGKRSGLEESVEGGDLFRSFKRPMGNKFNMGFGKRAGNKQFTMGFGKRGDDEFEQQFEY